MSMLPDAKVSAKSKGRELFSEARSVEACNSLTDEPGVRLVTLAVDEPVDSGIRLLLSGSIDECATWWLQFCSCPRA